MAKSHPPLSERPQRRPRPWKLYLGYAALAFLVCCLAAVIFVGVVIQYFMRDLPDYKQLANYNPPVVSRIYTGNGELLVEYANENRVFVPINAIPPMVIKAFLSAEDKNFYEHPGIDFTGVLRAIRTNVANLGKDRRPVGASTVTQQVAKNFLLSNELSIERKIKEAILAFRIEKAFTKDQILELYLNEIYLGGGAYGVAAAALFYFDKPLDQLTVAEAAYLAALPKAPNNYHPVRNYNAAVSRRNWVISRMYEDKYIAREQASSAQADPLVTRHTERKKFLEADYFGEEVRREIVKLFGSSELYGEGLYVKTTLDSRLQAIATRVLRRGMESYDRRHGWRGAVGQIADDQDWKKALNDFPFSADLDKDELAVVLRVNTDSADIGFKDGRTGSIPFSEMTWARPVVKPGQLGPRPKVPGDVLRRNDIIIARKLGAEGGPQPLYSLRQMPQINGALVALDPHTGRVLAMVGGYDRRASEFNRATQAARQPGSAIKPFVYLTALDKGYTPTTQILDAPFVVDQGPDQRKWKPSNASDQFYGPSTMRVGLEKSRNLMTVRLAQAVGMRDVANTIERFGISRNLDPNLAMALGAGETTLLRLTSAYGVLVNGGKEITPSLIDSIQDRRGNITYRHDTRDCFDCQGITADPNKVPALADNRQQISDPVSSYQIVSMLEGVVQRGTGQIIKSVGRPLAGKTGTSNDARDAWFIGFSPDLVVGVYAGFDNPRSLGENEYGANVAAPVFRDFMSAALQTKPDIPFRIPSGVRLVRVNATTGQPAQPGDKNIILEAFRAGTEGNRIVRIDGGTGNAEDIPAALGGTDDLGGIY